jgi:hypothetical protein
MKIHIIAIAYGRPLDLRILIDSFIVQTDPRWMLHIVYDGKPPQEILDLIKSYETPIYAKYLPQIEFLYSIERKQHCGHPNRKITLQNLQGSDDDFVLMTNDDNYYCKKYVEIMLRNIDGMTGAVTCNTSHSHFDYELHQSTMKEYYIDMGAFIVRFHVAKAVGFNHMHISADGKYAEECAAYCELHKLNIVHVPKPLWTHN